MQFGAKIRELKGSQEVIDFEWEFFLSPSLQNNNLEWLCCTWRMNIEK
jgi:hypothetical protein